MIFQCRKPDAERIKIKHEKFEKLRMYLEDIIEDGYFDKFTVFSRLEDGTGRCAFMQTVRIHVDMGSARDIRQHMEYFLDFIQKNPEKLTPWHYSHNLRVLKEMMYMLRYGKVTLPE